MRMPRVAVVTPHVTNGDAVCNDVLGMHEVLKQHGFEARVYAADWMLIESPLKVWPISTIDRFLKSETDVLIYHHSMGWDVGSKLLGATDCRKVIKYHNVTPPQFFSGWSEEYENVCRDGRDQVASIAASQCDVYLSDSHYNMSELIYAGAPEAQCFVVPPFNRIDQLFHVEPDFEIIDRYRDGKTNLLMVGSLFPNKGHASLLEVFAAYYHDYNPHSRLFIVGKESESLLEYSAYLRKLVTQLGLGTDVVFTGQVSEEELKSYYLMADVFVTTSKHEGFCVPLIESMALKIPIVAFGAAAIPETVGKVGLVWDEHNPYLFAESIDVLVKDEPVTTDIGLLARRRYDELFANASIESQFFNALGGVL